MNETGGDLNDYVKLNNAKKPFQNCKRKKNQIFFN